MQATVFVWSFYIAWEQQGHYLHIESKYKTDGGYNSFIMCQFSYNIFHDHGTLYPYNLQILKFDI